jgi:uncharacterized membrane protein YhhN
MIWGPMSLALAGLAAAFALAYGLVFARQRESFARALVKAAGAALLAGAFAVTRPSPLVVGFALCAVGDFFLAFDRKWTLPLGILAFLGAQLCFTLVFLFLWIVAPDGAPLWPRYLAMAIVGVIALAYVIWLTPKVRWLALALVPYAAAIAGMAAMSFWLPWAAWPGMAGAALFVISDGVLAFELFALPADAPVRRLTAPLVWWTYAGALALIAVGVLIAARNFG